MAGRAETLADPSRDGAGAHRDAAAADGTATATGGQVVVVPEEEREVRRGADVVRLVLAVAIVLASALAAALAEATLVRAQDGLSSLAELLPDALRGAMAGLAQLAVLAVPLAVLARLVLGRRTDVVVRVVLAVAAAVALGLVLDALADSASSAALEARADRPSWLARSGFPGTGYLTGLAAVVVVVGPWLSRGWRRALWAAVVTIGVLRFLSLASAPYELVAAGALGVAVGSAVLVALGAPDRAPSGQVLVDALAAGGVRLRRLEPAEVSRDGVHHHLAEDEDGRPLFLSLVSDDDQRRDLLFRLYRSLRVRNVADLEVLRSTRSLAEHRAFLSLWCRHAGVRTPLPVAVATVGDGAICVVEERLGDRSLADVDDLTDEELRAVWEQVAALGAARVAHRDLRASAIRLGGPPEHPAGIVDLTWARIGADARLRAIDVAQVLCEVALVAGAGRAVDAAVAALGPGRVAAALPFLQPPVLADDTRRRLRRHRGLVADLRAAVVEATGAEEVPLEKVERVTVAQVGTLAFTGLAVYLLLPMIVSLPDVWDALQEASWGWIALTAPLLALMFVGATIGFQGAVPARLPFGRTYEVQLASAFLNRVTPKNVGGMALRVRYLTTHGVEPATAAASVGLTSVAGTVSTTVLVVLFGLAAGRDADLAVSLPSLGSVLLVGVGLAALLGVLALTPWGRRLLVDRAWRYLRSAVSDVGPLLRDPAKLSALLGGNALFTLGQIAALAVCLEAFGSPLPAVQVGVVFLFANLVASASPTPGGVGVVEASQVFLLTEAGVDDAAATSAVLVARLVTYWSVTLPGWLALRRLRASEEV